MIITRQDFILRLEMDEPTLALWIAEEWIVPDSTACFSEADLARARLIRDLQHGMGVNEAGVGVILGLLDQVHGLRQALAGTLRAAKDR